jgi:hypothetical protein
VGSEILKKQEREKKKIKIRALNQMKKFNSNEEGIGGVAKWNDDEEKATCNHGSSQTSQWGRGFKG